MSIRRKPTAAWSRWARPTGSSALLLTAALACAHGQRAPPPAESVTTIQGPAGKLRVSDGGQGPAVPVLLVHGLGGTLDVWHAALEHLRRERRAAALDLRGHGQSDAPPALEGYSIEGLAEDVEAAAQSLKLTRLVLVGHSLAGAALTAYASRHPEKVAGLVYVDAIGDFHKLPKADIEKMLAADAKITDVRAAYQPMLGPHATPATREQVFAGLQQLKPGAFVALRRAITTYDASADARGYSGPAACIEAVKEPYPFLASVLLPRAQRRTMENVSHWLMLDDPQGFARELDAALSGMEK